MMTTDPETVSWLRVLLACAVVLAMMGGLGFALRYLSRTPFSLIGRNASNKRLTVIETMSLDVRRRLVIIQCDKQQHLILLGQDRDLVIETNLPSPDNVS